MAPHGPRDGASGRGGRPERRLGARRLDAVVVGAGIQGLQTARRLTDEGWEVAVLDRQPGLGGIWAKTNYANRTSRAQNHEPAYRIGRTPGAEDYSHRDSIIADMEEAASADGLRDLIHLGREVVRVEDEDGQPDVRVLHRQVADFRAEALEALPPANAEAGPLEEVCAGSVIFCTGTLQRPRRRKLPGEDAFAGPVVDGLSSEAERLDLAGKSVVVVGMGAFAIENARMALFAGAARVEMLARHKTVVMTRFARVMAISAENHFSSGRERAQRRNEPPLALTIDPGMLMVPPYVACGAQPAMPNAWHRDVEAGRPIFPFMSDSPTPWTTSDVFFIAHALEKLEVHNGEICDMEADAVTVKLRQGGTRRLRADVVIKNLGFESPDADDRLGNVCEVAGHRMMWSPIWITPRVVTFRHETEVFPMAPADWQHADELFSFVGSSTFGCSGWLELFLHFHARPADLKKLLAGGAGVPTPLPHKPIGATTKLDMARGIQAAYDFDPAVRAKVYARRRAVNEATYSRYAPRGSSPREQRLLWVAGFLERNRADWEDVCRRISGDPKAAPYVWEQVFDHLAAAAAEVEQRLASPMAMSQPKSAL